MKLSTALLAGSVGLNVVFAGMVILGSSTDETGSTGNMAVIAPRPQKPTEVPAPTPWDALKTDELATQRDRLRAEGFPPALVRAILVAEIHERFAGRRKTLEEATANLPFWKNPVLDPATQAAMRALDKEERSALRELLGADSDDTKITSLRRQLPMVTEDKIQGVAAIRDRYDEQRSDIYSGVRGMLSPQDQEKLRALDAAMHAEFASVLSPQELEDYDLRASSVANNLRFSLAAFDPTEQEFRTLYKLKDAFNQQYPSMSGPLTQDQMKALGEAQKQLDQQIAASLGADRYADYKRATDYNYRQTVQLVARLELPAETANTLYAIQQQYQQQRSGQHYASRDEMVQQLTAMQQEATDKVTTALGGSAQAVEAYKQYGGSWLKNMVPRATPASSATPKGGG